MPPSAVRRDPWSAQSNTLSIVGCKASIGAVRRRTSFQIGIRTWLLPDFQTRPDRMAAQNPPVSRPARVQLYDGPYDEMVAEQGTLQEFFAYDVSEDEQVRIVFTCLYLPLSWGLPRLHRTWCRRKCCGW